MENGQATIEQQPSLTSGEAEADGVNDQQVKRHSTAQYCP
jgi:hypothetical protein